LRIRQPRAPLLVAVLALSVAGTALAQGYGQLTDEGTLPAGTVLKARLDQRLNSAQVQTGQRFTATVQPDNDHSGLPAGTRVEGVVRDARPATKNQPGLLDVEFTALDFPNGRVYPITGALTSLDGKSVSRTASGRLLAKHTSSSDRMKFIGYGAGAGALIGLLTKGNLLTDSLLGAAGGYLYSQLNKDKSRGGYADVDLKSGAEFGVRLDRPFASVAVSNRLSDRYDAGLGGGSRSGVDLRNDRARSGVDLRNDRAPGNTGFGDRASISVTVDSRAVSFGAARPMRAGNSVLVPLAPVMSAAGVRYSYNPLTREISVSGGQGDVRATVGRTEVWVSGQRVSMEEPARSIEGTLYVPDRFLELATGMRASWDESSQTLRLTRRGINRDRDNRGTGF